MPKAEECPLKLNRLVFFNDDYSVMGGVEKVNLTWCELAMSHGFEAELADEHKRDLFFEKHPKLIRSQVQLFPNVKIKRNPFIVVCQLYSIWKWIQGREGNLIFVQKRHHVPCFGVAKALGLLGKNKLVFLSHTSTSTFEKLYDAWFHRVLFWFYDKLIVLIEDHQKVSWPYRNCFEFPNPIYPSKHKVQHKKNIVLYAGRFAREKNIDLLLNAWSLVEKENHLQDWELHLYGEGPELERLQNLKNKLSLSRALFFMSSSTIRAVIKEVKIFVLTSDMEGLPVAAIEAMSEGVPFISTVTDGSKRIIEHGKDGLIIPERTPKDTYEALNQIMSSKDWEIYSAAAKQKSLEFLPERCWHRFENLTSLL
jgi:glycosyltransferase involved in cell wall biosynthesis